MEKKLPYTKAICYSGFRDGQSPELNIFPSYEEVKEDLLLLAPHWQSLRLYNCDEHAETVLQVIRNEGLHFDVMLGAYILAEVNNPECPWGGEYPNTELAVNTKLNQKRVERLIEMTNKCSDIITSVSAGNEAAVDWTDHLVSNESLLTYVERLKDALDKPVTFCENYVPWLEKIKPVGEAVDFISIHTYPIWEYKGIDEALQYTKDNYHAVANSYPNKQVVITEAGWTTKSNGRGIEPHNASEELQQDYVQQLMQWAEEEEILLFLFEAFDENWKGSNDPLEPEKHWGIYRADRTPKSVMVQELA